MSLLIAALVTFTQEERDGAAQSNECAKTLLFTNGGGATHRRNASPVSNMPGGPRKNDSRNVLIIGTIGLAHGGSAVT
jgi:hypothetical protein